LTRKVGQTDLVLVCEMGSSVGLCKQDYKSLCAAVALKMPIQYSQPLLSAVDFDPQSRSDWPSFGVRPGFISRSVQARLQVSVCSGYNLCNPS